MVMFWVGLSDRSYDAEKKGSLLFVNEDHAAPQCLSKYMEGNWMKASTFFCVKAVKPREGFWSESIAQPVYI